jgi:hypothetical protein
VSVENRGVVSPSAALGEAAATDPLTEIAPFGARATWWRCSNSTGVMSPSA